MTPTLHTQITVTQARLQRLRSLIDSFWGAVLGTFIYAAWAAYANWEAGSIVAIRAALTQWLISIIVTYYGFAVMRWCYGSSRPWVAGLRAFLGGLTLTYIFAFTFHGFLGTPNILLTLAAGLIPNVFIDASYALLLMRTQSHS